MISQHAWGGERILSFLQEGRILKRALMDGDDSVRIPSPRFISCWISEKCNLDCTYCYFSETNADKSHQYIDTNRFCSWLEEAKKAGSESLEFSGGGEPTLHPDFIQIITAAMRMKFAMGLITHACNEMPIEYLVEIMKYVRCGLDAATSTTHDAIKRNRRKDYWFHRAIENIRRLVEFRDAINPNGFTVGIKIVINSINFHEFRKMIELARELRVNYIQFKYEHSSDHLVDNDELGMIELELNREKTRNNYSFTKVLGTMHHARATVKCFMSPIHTVVTATGKILQCCFFESRPIGTIFQPFHEIWSGEQHRKVIEMTTVQECDKVDCRWNIWNRQMKEIIEDPLASVSFI